MMYKVVDLASASPNRITKAQYKLICETHTLIDLWAWVHQMKSYAILLLATFREKNSKTVHNYVISDSIKQIRVSVFVYRFNQSIENLNSDN